MNVTKLLPACFDLNEGSLNIIIHNLCFVRVCVWYVLSVGPCSALHAAMSSGA